MLRIVYSYAMMAPSTKERTMAMKKCINILLYAAFFGILAAQRPIQEYSTIHFNIPYCDLLHIVRDFGHTDPSDPSQFGAGPSLLLGSVATRPIDCGVPRFVHLAV